MKLLHRLPQWLQFNLRYLGKPPWDTGVSPPELLAIIAEKQPGRALDLGCGTGTNLLTLAEKGWEVTGVDLALLSVLKARRKFRKAGVSAAVFQGDVASDVLPNRHFDLIFDIGCFHNLSPEGREQYRQNVERWLEPGGVYLIYAHQKHMVQGFHGVDEQDIQWFKSFLQLTWQRQGNEVRPGGDGGWPSVWARFDRRFEVENAK